MFRQRTFQERLWEILPGLQFWTVFFGAILLSFYQPIWAALFIICFDLYWVLKAVNVATHLVAAYRKFKFIVRVNWLGFTEALNDLPGFLQLLNKQLISESSSAGKKFYKDEIKKIQTLISKQATAPNYLNYYHLILIPFIDESFEVLDSTLSAITGSAYPKEKMIMVLGSEQRAGEQAQEVARQIKEKYQSHFYKFFVSLHPDGLEGEIKGKSANASFAIQSLLPELAKLNIAVEQVLVSNFDSDTIIHPQYFARVMYEFLLSDKPYQKSFQPIAVYNNNI